MSEKYGYIYQIENLINGKKYIGQTTNKKGYRSFPSGYKDNNYLYRSYEKYGIENFEITIIDDAKNQKKLNKKEIFYIKKFNTLNSDFGYNMRHGGSKGKKIIFSKNYLKREYLTNKKTTRQIGKENNCSDTTIYYELRKYNIPIRTGNQKFSFTKNFLEQEYLMNKKSMPQIAKENNCSVSIISKKLRKYNVPTRVKTENISFTKEFLEFHYIDLNLSMKEIAIQENCTDSTILNKLRKYNIPTRNNCIPFKKEFLEQEYLINKKSMRQIADENNCSDMTIFNKLRKYNIPTR